VCVQYVGLRTAELRHEPPRRGDNVGAMDPQGLHGGAEGAYVRSQTALVAEAEDPDVEAGPVGVVDVVENHALEASDIKVDHEMEHPDARIRRGELGNMVSQERNERFYRGGYRPARSTCGVGLAELACDTLIPEGGVPPRAALRVSAQRCSPRRQT
jgi:hypothetical protein